MNQKQKTIPAPEQKKIEGPQTPLQTAFVSSVNCGSYCASRIGGAIAGIVWALAAHFLFGIVRVGGFAFGFLLFAGFAIGAGWLVSWILRGGK